MMDLSSPWTEEGIIEHVPAWNLYMGLKHDMWMKRSVRIGFFIIIIIIISSSSSSIISMMFIHFQGFNDINGLPPDNQTSNGQSPIYRCFFTQLQTSISWWISIAMFDYRRVYHIQSLLYPYDG